MTTGNSEDNEKKGVKVVTEDAEREDAERNKGEATQNDAEKAPTETMELVVDHILKYLVVDGEKTYLVRL